MDGGRRVLRSLKESVAASLPLARFSSERVAALAAPAAQNLTAPVNPNRPSPRRRGPRPWLERLTPLGRAGVGSVATFLLFGAVGFAGLSENGGYAAFVAREGRPWDIAARALGFEIAAVTITGQSRMTEQELLAAAGVGPRDSLPFLDANAVRENLEKVPLVKSARVMKLFPNRLVVAIEERQAKALWQRDGHVWVVSEDGVAIDELRDERYLGLPFVVGEGAQKRLLEFSALMKSAGDLSNRVKAGVLVSGRRWNLEMTNGVTVKLPEANPGGALAALDRLQREARILDKDVMFVDLRTEDRVVVRLTEDAAAAREATASIKKPHKSGG